MLDPARWPELDALLDRALALPASEREAFARDVAAADVDLLQAVQAVLREAEAPEEFLPPGGALSAESLEAIAADDPPLLAEGQRFGEYEILELLGRGGMGEVFRARDATLRRDVALKVPRLSRGPEVVTRLKRESRLLASLNHPNIATIYGLAESGDVRALVLEYVDGPTLASRLEDGAFRPEEAVPIARQVARALEAAHAIGIVHRDLKPANVKITPDGLVKVLDFGLAKVFLEPGDGRDDSATDLTAAAQRIGLVFGTAAYMSPEQARGLPVDHRSDIWAFGCLLYEMLTGVRAFSGRTTTDVLARVLEREPEMHRLPPGTPPALNRLVKRCLAKDPARRLAHISDAVIELDEAESELARPRAPRVRRAWIAAAGAAGVILMLAGAAALWPSRPVPMTAALAIPIPSTDELLVGSQPFAAVSPDGRTLVYRARRGGVVQLFRRNLDSLEVSAIRGTENGAGPFFSPDGRWLGFDADGTLKRVPVDGGTAVTICRAAGGATSTWTDEDTILFATNTSRGLRKVRSQGGDPQDVTRVDPSAGEIGHFFPAALPGGRVALITIIRNDERQIATVDLASGAITPLLTGSQAQYLRSGHIVFAREGALWVAPFDARRSRLDGTPTQIVDGLGGGESSSVQFAVTDRRALIYMPRVPAVQRMVAFVDRQGRISPTSLERRPYLRASLSPDQQRVALSVGESGDTDVWVAQLGRAVFTRLTFDPLVDASPIWSADGKHVLFRSERDGGGIYRRAADGSGTVERIVLSTGPLLTPNSWDTTGRTLFFTEFRGYGEQSIARVHLDEPTVIERLLVGSFAQLRPQLSPDGRWLAYQSDESGKFEVYVRPYPDVQGARWQISTGGGFSPKWRADGRELFFYDGRGIAAVAVDPASAFQASSPRRLFEVSPLGGRLGPDFDVTEDGERFLMVLEPSPAASRPRPDVFILQNWLK